MVHFDSRENAISCELLEPVLRDADSELALRLACRSELIGQELTSIDVVRVDFNEALPLLGQVIFFKDRRYGTDWHAGATVNALRGVDVELLDIIETWAAVILGIALFRMNTLPRASVYTGRVFGTDARFGDNICHFLPPFSGFSLVSFQQPFLGRLRFAAPP